MRTLRLSVRGSDGEGRGVAAYGSRGEKLPQLPRGDEKGVGKARLEPLPLSSTTVLQEVSRESIDSGRI